jgi:hypothetical protein
MSFSTLSVTRTVNSPNSLWGNSQRLVVVFVKVAHKANDYYLVYGIDAAHANPDDNLVFERILPAGDLGEFLRALVDGEPIPANPVIDPLVIQGRNNGSPVIANSVISQSVDISNPPTVPPGPKLLVVLAYANVVRTSEFQAESAPPETAIAIPAAVRRRSGP